MKRGSTSSSSSDRQPIVPKERQTDFGSINQKTNYQDYPKEDMKIENKYEIWGMPLIAEFFGQLIFAFMHSMSANTIGITNGALGSPILPAMTDGLLVAIMVITIGHISGAHVNGAVTLGVTLAGGLKPIMFPLYIVVQLLGSMTGAGLAFVVNGQASGAFALGTGVTVGQGMLCEIMLTSLLVFAVLMSAVDQGSPLAAFAIGFAIMIDIYAGFSISGGCMNPTLSFGPAVVAGKWKNYWIYWVGPAVGAVIAAVLHRLGLGSREKRFLFKENGEDEAPVKMEKSGDGGESNPEYNNGADQSNM